MPIRSTTHCKKSLRPGAIVFVAGVTHSPRGYKRIPVRATVVEVKKDPISHIDVVYVVQFPQLRQVWGAFVTYPDAFFCPGDRGVRGFRYDSRAEQCFTTRKACEAAIKRWGDQNPNFIHHVCKGDRHARRF